MNQDAPQKLASIILLSYNSKNDLKECIPSLTNQTYSNHEIIIVDNASTDDTSEFVRTNYPDIRFVDTGSNLGYPAGNNIGFQHASGEYIVILNPYTVAEPDWLKELIMPFEDDPEIGLTTSKILIYGQEGIINTCGNSIHYTGLDFILFDYLLQVFVKIQLPLLFGTTLVSDRYVYDMVITDLPVDLDYSDEKMKTMLRSLLKIIPKPDVAFLIDVPEEVAFARKDDVPDINYLKERRGSTT